METWKKLLSSLQKKIHPQDFSLWIEPLSTTETKDKLILNLPTPLHYQKIVNEYLPLIKEVLKELRINKEIVLEWKNERLFKEPSYITATKTKETPPYNKNYTFDNFITGPENQLVFSIAKEITLNSSTPFNPIYIYGPHGVGKTHLLLAIVNSIHENPNDNRKVIYITGEQFAFEFIRHIQKGEIEYFHKRYRKECDLFILDDFQYLSGKTKTQLELYNTIKRLLSENKQVIISSDLPLKEIPKLDLNLISLLSSGVVLNIKLPGPHLKKGLIKNKMERLGINIESNLLEIIASYDTEDLRQIDGVILRIAAEVKFNNRKLTKELIHSCIKSYELNSTLLDRKLYLKEIEKIVCNYLNLQEIKPNSRKKEETLPRQIIMYLGRDLLNLSFKEISEYFGKKTHATPLYAYKKLKKAIREDPQLKLLIEDIIKEVKKAS